MQINFLKSQWGPLISQPFLAYMSFLFHANCQNISNFNFKILSTNCSWPKWTIQPDQLGSNFNLLKLSNMTKLIIAWFTSTRGVYQVWLDGSLTFEFARVECLSLSIINFLFRTKSKVPDSHERVSIWVSILTYGIFLTKQT